VSSSDRYEPAPGFAELPGWLWRRTGTALKAGVAVALVLVVAGAAVTAVASRRDARKADDAAAARTAAVHREEVAKARAEQKPVPGHASGSRTAMAAEMSDAILADARARASAGELKGPILRVACDRFPKTVGPVPREDDRRYSCVAVTAEIARSRGGEAGAIGHPYRAFLHFQTGRYAFCKISARLDPVKNPEVTTPAACGG
jgi:hypothetical protein